MSFNFNVRTKLFPDGEFIELPRSHFTAMNIIKAHRAPYRAGHSPINRIDEKDIVWPVFDKDGVTRAYCGSHGTAVRLALEWNDNAALKLMTHGTAADAEEFGS